MAERLHLTATNSWSMGARRALSDAGVRVLALVRALRHRGEVRQLAELDDRALKDIGLTRLDVIGALGEPMFKDPSTVLMVRSVERRSRNRTMAVTPAEALRTVHPQQKGRSERVPLTS